MFIVCATGDGPDVQNTKQKTMMETRNDALGRRLAHRHYYRGRMIAIIATLVSPYEFRICCISMFTGSTLFEFSILLITT